MANTCVEKRMKNINIDGVENCNLLCKLIIDYVPSNKCIVKKTVNSSVVAAIDDVDADASDDNAELNIKNENAANICEYIDAKTYIDYPAGSFINYRDTSYEATRVFFFAPSRHSIDNEQFDFEVNIYHGTFIEGENREGIVSHAHYKSDTNKGNYNHNYHYHTNTNQGDSPHEESYQRNSNHNIVSCILFNRDDHKGTNTNVFFNQFVNNKDFKNGNTITKDNPLKINTHNNWSLEDLLPKRRSFFMYEDEGNKNTYIVFDNINSIDQGILNILKKHTYDEPNPIEKLPGGNVLYKSNIEVITDERYKADMRKQIKDLLGITRTMARVSNPAGEARDYAQGARDIYMNYASGGGAYQDFSTNETSAKNLTDKWNDWGKGQVEKKTISQVREELKYGIDNDTLKKKVKNKYGELEFDPNIDYRVKYESVAKISELEGVINTTATDKVTDDANFKRLPEEFYKLDKIREYVYKYNKILLGYEYKELTVPNAADAGNFTDDKLNLTNLGIQNKIKTGLTVDKILKQLNNIEYKVTSEISLINYDGNINIFTGDAAFNNSTKTLMDIFDIPDSKPKEVTDNEITFVKGGKIPIIILHYIDLGNDMCFYDVDSKITVISPSIDFIPPPPQPPDNDYLKILQLWRYIIQKDKSLLYTNESDIFERNYFSYNEGESFNFNKELLKTFTIDTNTFNIIKPADGPISVLEDSSQKYNISNTNKITSSGIVSIDTIFYDNTTDYKANGETDPITNYNAYALKYLSFSIQNPDMKSQIMYNIINLFSYANDFTNLKLHNDSLQLDQTIDGDKCQDWNSNKFHNETSITNFLSEHPEFTTIKTYAELTREEKEYIRHGLLKYNETAIANDTINVTNTWSTHNKCRNPGNRKQAPWCYTTNPNVRWQYCAKPDRGDFLARLVLIITFLMCIILAYLMVRVIFRHEYFTIFMAKLTGSKPENIGATGVKSGSSAGPS